MTQARQHDVTITSGTLPLAATVVEPAAASGAGVLLVHGLGSDRGTNVERALALAERHAVTALALDLAGHGSSGGRLSAVTPRQNLTDVLAGYDTLAGLPGVEPDRVGVAAASYGAYLSVLLTGHRPLARLLLRAPALYTDDVLDTPLAQRRRGDVHTAPLLLDRFAHVVSPVLVVESEHDEVVGPEVVAAYLRARPGTGHAVLPGAGHALTDPRWRAAYEQVLLAFFADL